MKFVRVLYRLAVLSLTAAILVGLTAMYGGSVRLSLPNPRWQDGREHRPSAPQLTQVTEFVGEGMILAIVALGGRLIFRLRLNPVSRRKGPISLNLQSRTPGP